MKFVDVFARSSCAAAARYEQGSMEKVAVGCLPHAQFPGSGTAFPRSRNMQIASAVKIGAGDWPRRSKRHGARRTRLQAHAAGAEQTAIAVLGFHREKLSPANGAAELQTADRCEIGSPLSGYGVVVKHYWQAVWGVA